MLGRFVLVKSRREEVSYERGKENGGRYYRWVWGVNRSM